MRGVVADNASFPFGSVGVMKRISKRLPVLSLFMAVRFVRFVRHYRACSITPTGD